MPSAKLYRRLVPGALAFSLAIVGLRAASLAEISGVGNFHQVDEHVYRGAQPNGEGFSGLAKLGIKTVIDLRGERSEEHAVERTGMRYIRLAWSGFKAPEESQIASVLALLDDSSGWPVFVHCRRGADRTGTAIACYRIAHDHWTNERALEEARSLGMSSLEIAMQHFILHFAPPVLAQSPVSTSAAAAIRPTLAPSLSPAP